MNQAPQTVLATLTAILSLSSGCPRASDPGLVSRCVEPTPWGAGTPMFLERDAAAVGLLGVLGSRLSAVDVDNDGDTDLVARTVGAGPNDTSLAVDDAARTGWLLLNNGDGTFVDGSAASRLWTARGNVVGRPGEVMAFADVDGDGFLDAFSGVDTTDEANAAGETSEILLGSDDGFALGPADHDLRRAGLPDLPASASFVDFDRDGHVDLWVTEHNYDGLNFIGDRLYRGDGSGRFVDVGEDKGVVSAEWTQLPLLNDGLAHTRSWAGIACDLDGDAHPELLSASYGRAPNHLWQYRAGGYDNVSVSSGYAYDDDFTWQDNQFALCFCAEHPDAADCDTVTAKPLIACDQDNWNHATDREPFRLGGNNATSVCGDVDNDGDLDVLTTTIRHWWAGSGADMAEILINRSHDGVVRFDRPGRDVLGLTVEHNTGVAWDEGFMTAALFDVDNDGRLDVYLGGSDYPGNRGLLFHNDGVVDGSPRFSPVSVDDSFEHNRSHGIAVADFDDDGDLDVIVGHSRSRCDASLPNDCYPTTNVRYFENVVGDQQNAFKLRLRQKTGSNSAAIGARVIVTTVVDGETRVQVREIGGGHGHFGMQDDLVQTFGLGSACEASVTVRWPVDGVAEQTFTAAAGYRFDVVEGEAVTATPLR